MLRLLRLAALVCTLIVVVAACGGGDDDKDESSTAAAPAASGATSGAAAPTDAATLLGAARVQSTGAARTKLSLKANVDGTPKDALLGAFLSGPIEVTVDGVADATSKAGDLKLNAKAGALNVDARLLSDGTNGWVGLSDTYYALPAGSLGGATMIDPAQLSGALGSPAAYLVDPQVVGSEDVEGVKAQHVTGQVDAAKLSEALQGLSSVAGSTGLGSVLGDGQLQLTQDALKSAKADVWIADDTKDIVRLALDLDVELPQAQAASSGVEGVKVLLDATTVPTDPPKVEAPADARPAEELQSALLGLLAGSGALGGALGNG
jgi:hypothetical protein